MTVQYSNFYEKSQVLLSEYHPSVDLVSIIPCQNKEQAKRIKWAYSVGIWKIKKLK